MFFFLFFFSNVCSCVQTKEQTLVSIDYVTLLSWFFFSVNLFAELSVKVELLWRFRMMGIFC